MERRFVERMGALKVGNPLEKIGVSYGAIRNVAPITGKLRSMNPTTGELLRTYEMDSDASSTSDGSRVKARRHPTKPEPIMSRNAAVLLGTVLTAGGMVFFLWFRRTPDNWYEWLLGPLLWLIGGALMVAGAASHLLSEMPRIRLVEKRATADLRRAA